jgi:hypothetical protein
MGTGSRLYLIKPIIHSHNSCRFSSNRAVNTLFGHYKRQMVNTVPEYKAVYYFNETKNMDTECKQNAELLDVRADGTQS